MSNSDKPESIVIVGGGTAGWITAAFLCRAWGDSGPAITLVESPQVATVGVGESTIPPFRRLLASLGIDESDWMPKCNATYKCASSFVDWSQVGEHYYHPLFCWGEDSADLFHSWHEEWASGNCNEPFDSCFQAVHLARGRRSPRHRLRAHSPIQYAYHLDAALFANYLRDWSCSHGVRRIEDHVTSVSTLPDGKISNLQTRNSGPLSGDYFFDCTGFRGLLINEALQEPFVSYSDALFCDSAVAVMSSRGTSDQIDCATTATALSAGWSWNVPLTHRNGNGYVYSSMELSPDDAANELVAHLGRENIIGEPRQIQMRVGRTRRAWVSNCISIGLSAGFIEPLEATAIFCIQYGIAQFVAALRQHPTESQRRAAYNTSLQDLFEGIRDFIVLHYHLTTREDSEFWRANKYHAGLPSSLQAILTGWRAGEDVGQLLADSQSAAFVSSASWHCILAGMGCLPPRGGSEKNQSTQISERVGQLTKDALGYPMHFDALRH